MATLFKIFVKAAAILMLLAAAASAQTADKLIDSDSSDIRVLEERLKQQEKNNETKLEAIRNEIEYRDSARKSEIELRAKELEKRIELYFWGGSLVLIFIAFLLRFLGAKTMANWIKDKINEKVNEITEKELETTWGDIFLKFAEQKTDEYERTLADRLNKLEKEREEYLQLKNDLFQMKEALAMKEPSPEEPSEKYEEFEEKLKSIKREEQYTAIDWVIKGQKEKSKNNHYQAIEYYSKAIEMNPAFAAIYNVRGVVYISLLEYESAIKDFSKAIELNLETWAVYYNRGLCYGRLREHKEAIADLNKAIELDASVQRPFNALATHQMILGNYAAALKSVEKALTLDLDDEASAVLYYKKCIITKLLGFDTIETEKAFTAALEKEFVLNFHFDTITHWLSEADLPPDTRRFIEEKIEMLKRKMK